MESTTNHTHVHKCAVAAHRLVLALVRALGICDKSRVKSE